MKQTIVRSNHSNINNDENYVTTTKATSITILLYEFLLQHDMYKPFFPNEIKEWQELKEEEEKNMSK